jgi:NAD(P) transhydrogenase
MSDQDFDLVVIGSGPAGEKGAAQAAYFGHRVAVVERQARPGGAPVNSGGLPTKTLRETALYLTGFRRREVYGIGMDIGPDLTLDRMRTRAAAVSEVASRLVQENIDRHGMTLVHGTARLGPDRSVVVAQEDGSMRVLRGRVVLIATGSRPFRPDAVPFDDPDVHDSDSILGIGRIPRSLVVIGGGPVGCEYASIFAALGVHVTLVDRGDRLMPFLDREASEQLSACISDIGVRLLLAAPQATVARHGGELRVRLGEGETLTTQTVLYAAGRSGNTEDLGLEDAGVELDARGRIVVDERYQTAVPRIYAAGDVIGPPALAAVSAEQGRVAMCHAFDIPF